MTAIEKFTFALSFDDADNVIRSSGGDDEHYELGKKKKKKKEEEVPPPPPAIYTEEQASQMIAEAEQKAREQGLAEGHAQGLEQGRQEILNSLEKAVGDVEAVIAEKLAQIDEQQKRANAKINEDAIHVALGVIRKLAPAWSKQYELTEIEHIVRQCLANLFDAPKVMIKVNPDLAQPLDEAAKRIAQSRGFSGKVIVIGEPEIAAGDCMVSWGDGTAVRNTARIWSEINNIVDNALSQHAEEHGLPESEMSDPEIQETRIPAAPEPEAPEAEAVAEPVSEDLSADTVETVGADAQDAGPADTAMPPQSEPATASTTAPATAPVGEAIDAPDAAAEPPENSDVSGMQEDGVKEGDGTGARNVQTSPADAIPVADNILETPQEQATAVSPNGDGNGTGEAPLNAARNQEDDNTATTEPQDAVPTGNVAPKQAKTGAQGSTGHPDNAEDGTAVKQPTKDAGDKNG